MTKTPSEHLAEPSLEDPLNDSFEFLITSNAISPMTDEDDEYFRDRQQRGWLQ
ncbi:hypothetical protein OIE68_41925 [Nocardia vinacea]|uniref:hypothetical protein n=1 Tax=Nocardia vinacea TaxID=96468 RepID=UPI002E116F9C|nr:hypothetical protein OIE68_41925 [Nocardia vinacea]